MKHSINIGMIVSALVCLPSVSIGQESSVQQAPPINQAAGAPVFPPSAKCTNNSPCTNVAGEILKIEESYWIRDRNGREIHLRVTGDSNLKELPKVGDNISAQLDSSGDVQALMKLPGAPKPPIAEVPSKTFEDLR